MREQVVTAPGGRILVVGDLHGMYDEAVELLQLCQLTAADKVVFCGDLVDRGPDNDKCVDLAMQHACVMGNHEERHIAYRAMEKAGQSLHTASASHVATRAQLRDEHYEYFESLPHLIRLPEHNAVVVHAGVFPGIPLEAQETRHLTHIQMVNPPEKKSKWPSKAPADWEFWTKLWKGPERIIFGHSVLSEPLITEFAVGIDGGAVFGRELWAYELPSGKTYRVAAQVDHGKGSRGSSGKPVKTFPVHGQVFTWS